MTIEISRGDNTFQYRQRAGEPTVIERRATYRGAPWVFVARHGSAEEARMALLKLAPKGFPPQEGKSDE